MKSVALKAIALVCAVSVSVSLGIYEYNRGLSDGVEKRSKELEPYFIEMENRLERLKAMQDETSRIISSIEIPTVERHEVEISTVHPVLAFHGDFEAAVFTITAYSPYDDRNGLSSDGNPNTTATGTKPGPGTFAVDPDVIPYGSKVYIIYPDGNIEQGIAEDTGSAIAGKRGEKRFRIDVFRHTFDDAMAFGKQRAVVIWYNGDDEIEN